MQNNRFLNALQRQPVDRTPVWIMRQAGRYLPEYRATRQKAGDFLTLCKTPELACEVTLQPIRRFELDAAILFSDILTIPDAMGMGLRFSEGEGPYFENPIRTASDIEKLGVPDPEIDLRYVIDAVKLIRHELDQKVPLIGFAGSPWTIATYMVEGRGSKQFNHIKKMLYKEPALLTQLLSILTSAITDYLNAQIKAGAQAVMLFDTWGGILTTDAYQQFSLLPMQKIIEGLIKEQSGQSIPSILFTKGGGQWLTKQSEVGANALGVDWTIDLSKAKQMVNGKVALQGNMDPSVLYGDEKRIREEVQSILRQFGPNPGHIFNLGHGIYPDISPENVAIMIDEIKNSRPIEPLD
ncbi:MAG: uroporphyrinogen decarboxylase [Gammaproteobacteria bacterium]